MRLQTKQWAVMEMARMKTVFRAETHLSERQRNYREMQNRGKEKATCLHTRFQTVQQVTDKTFRHLNLQLCFVHQLRMLQLGFLQPIRTRDQLISILIIQAL